MAKISKVVGNGIDGIEYETREVKEVISDTIDDLVKNLTYYDRKEDDDLTEEILDNAIEYGEITIDEMVDKFRECLKKTYPDQI